MSYVSDAIVARCLDVRLLYDGVNDVVCEIMIGCQGWAIFSDKVGAIEMARTLATQVRWEARVIDLQNGSDQRLLVCQKPFIKK